MFQLLGLRVHAAGYRLLLIAVLVMLSACSGPVPQSSRTEAVGQRQAVAEETLTSVRQGKAAEEEAPISAGQGKAISEEGLTLGKASEAFQASGLLLGLRYDGDKMEFPYYSYDTLWFKGTGEEPSLLHFSDALVWPSSEWEKKLLLLRAFQQRTPEDDLQYVRLVRPEEGAPPAALSLPELAEEHVQLVEQVRYVGGLGVGLSVQGRFWAGNAPASRAAEWMLSYEQMNTSAGYSYDDFQAKESISLPDVIGEAAAALAAAELLKLWETQERELDLPAEGVQLESDSSYKQWNMVHEKGGWSAGIYGTYNVMGGSKFLFRSNFDAKSVVPLSEQGGELDWDALLLAYPNARDAVLSPDDRTAVIIMPTECIVALRFRDGTFSEPVHKRSIGKNASIVLVQWADEKSVESWDERLRYGYLLLAGNGLGR